MRFADVFVDLVKYCARKNVPFTTFDDWTSILSKVKEIVAGETTVQDAAKEGYEAYKKTVESSNGKAT